MRRLSCAGARVQVRLWDIERRRVVARLAGHGGWVWCMEPHPTLPSTLLTGATDGASPPTPTCYYATVSISFRFRETKPRLL